MASVTDKGGFLRACGAMEETNGFGVDVAHALAMSADTPAESYYIRVVYADQGCYTKDLIRELLIGDVAEWAWDYRKCPGRGKGFLTNMLAVLIDERTTQRCRQCKGTCEVAVLEGGKYKQQRLRTMPCPTCGGEGVKKYGDSERARSLGLDPEIYRRHWKSLCDRIEGKFVYWDDKINRIGRYRLWSE